MGSPAQPGTSPYQVLAWLLFTGFDVLILIYVIALPFAQPQNWDFHSLSSTANPIHSNGNRSIFEFEV
jgi:hypothetical protein